MPEGVVFVFPENLIVNYGREVRATNRSEMLEPVLPLAAR